MRRRARREKARALGARELEGDALMHESTAAALVGDRLRALLRASQAYELFLFAYSEPVLRRARAAPPGQRLWRTGDLPGARALFLEAEDVFTRLGNENDSARAMHGFATSRATCSTRKRARHLSLALPMYERAGNLLGVEATHANIGSCLRAAATWTGRRRPCSAPSSSPASSASGTPRPSCTRASAGCTSSGANRNVLSAPCSGDADRPRDP